MDAGLKNIFFFIHIPSEEGMVLNTYEKKFEIPFYARRNCNSLLVKWFSGSKFKLPKMSKDFLNDGWKDDRHNMVNRAHFSIQLKGVQK